MARADKLAMSMSRTFPGGKKNESNVDERRDAAGCFCGGDFCVLRDDDGKRRVHLRL